MSLIYGEYLVSVHFSDIPHTFIPHFTLHSAEKICIKFSANYPLTTFRIPQNTPSRLSLLLARTKTACANKAADFIAPFIRAYDPLKGTLQRRLSHGYRAAKL